MGYFPTGSHLFPFGADVDDLQLPRGDDVVSETINLRKPVTLFGSQYKEIVVRILILSTGQYHSLLW